MIRFEAVSKQFEDGTTAVNALDLQIAEGELTVLVGPSGCGKPTTLRMMHRLEEPSGGRIAVNGRDIMQTDRIALRRGIRYAIQPSGPSPHRRSRAHLATAPTRQ